MNWRTGTFLILVTMLTGTMACQPDQNDDSEPLPPYHFVDFVRYAPTCASDSLHCASVKIQYLQYDSLADGPRQAINTSIRSQVLEAIAGQMEQEVATLDQAAQAFIDDYEEYASVDFAMPWTLEAYSEVLRADDHWFVLAVDTYVFTGGAHPNSFRMILNYDLKTGRLFSLDEVIKDKRAFSAVAEAIFRKEKGIQQDTPLEQAGFFMEDFKLATQFALRPAGLLLFYNTYEIAPYVVGVTEFEIPYEQIQGMIHDDYLLP